MDIAVAIEPLCMTKEETMIDAINSEFLNKNPGIAANLSLVDMERLRQEGQQELPPNYRNIYFSPPAEAGTGATALGLAPIRPELNLLL
jgi:hypothetical protein